MATKTLGIKFEVAGVSEATAQLNAFRDDLNSSVEQNKKALQQRLNLLKPQQLAVDINSNNTTNTNKTSSTEPFSRITKDFRQALADFKNSPQTIYVKQEATGIVQAAARDILKEIIKNQFFKLFARPEKQSVPQEKQPDRVNVDKDFKGRSAIYNNSVRIRFTPEAIRDIRSIFLSQDVAQGKKGYKNIIRLPNQNKNLIGKLIEPVTSRIDHVTSGYFGGIGSYFGKQFAEGLDGVLQSELDISHQRKGQIAGKTYAYFQTGKEELLSQKFETLRQTIVDLNDETSSVGLAQVQATIKAILGIPNALADSFLTGFRRSSIEVEAIRKVGKDKAKFSDGESIDNLAEFNHAVINASGFSGSKGQQARKQAQSLRELNTSEDTTIFSSDTPFTDVAFQAKDAVSGAAWAANALANTMNINLKGFNPDAIEMVNKVLAMREQNPKIEITLSGHSAGGFVVEEAQYLLELMEVEGTRAVTLGTPNLKGGVKPKNIQRIFSKNDPLQKIHDAAEYLDFVNQDTEYDNVPQGHLYDQYLASSNVRQAIFRRDGKPIQSEPQPIDDPWSPDSASRRPSPIERASLIGGDLVVSILESEGDIAQRAEIFRNIIAEGFAQVGEDLKGYAEDFAGAIANSFNRGLPNPIESLNINADALRTNLIQLFKEALIAPLNDAIAEYRRVALRTVAIPAAKERRDEILRDNPRNTGSVVTEDTDTLLMGVGGLAGGEGRTGAYVARVARQELEDSGNTKVIWISNENSDIPRNSNFNSPSSSFPSEGNINIAGSVIKPRIRGYSPDSINGLANALAAIERNPEIKIKIVAYSGGGDVAEEIIEMLNMLGHGDRVQGIGVGSPSTIGNLNPANYQRVISAEDPVIESANRFGNNQGIENSMINTHSLEDYRYSAEFQRFLNGSSGQLSLNEGKDILATSQDFIRNYAFGSRSDALIDDKDVAMQTITLLRDFIPDAEAEVKAMLEAAMKNFVDFLALLAPDDRFVVEQRRVLSEGIGFLVDGGDKEQAIEVRDRVIRSSDQNRTASRIENGDNPQMEAIDRELVIVIERLNEFIRNYKGATSELGSKEKLAEAYKEHLQAISNKTTENRAIPSQVIARDFAASTPDRQKELLTFIRENFSAKAKDYRTSVKSGQLELAVEQGKELIRVAASVKSLYGELANFKELDPEVQGVFKSYSGYVTSVENEVKSGTGGKGRVNVGLPDLIGEQVDLAASGDEVAAGLIESIEASLAEVHSAGEEIGSALAEGANESLEIKSPSEVFRRIGEFVVAGFRQGLEGVDDAVDEVRENLDDPGEGAETGIVGTVKNFIGGMLDSVPVIGKFKGAIVGVGTAILGAFGIGFAIGNLQDLAAESLSTAQAVEALNRSITFVSRSSSDGAKNLAFITSEAKKISADLSVAKEAYAGFLGAAKGTAIEGDQTDRIFSAFASAAANRGLDEQSQGRLFTAVEQIISKRYLGAEEVRGQIGDVFPGFEGILSDALGVPSSQLSEMMSNRELGLDVLPKVAAVLEAQNASAGNIQTAQMAQTKYNNALNEFKALFGSVLQPLQKFSLNFVAESVNKLTTNLTSLLTILRNLAGVVLIALYGQVNVLNVAMAVSGTVLNTVGKGLVFVYRNILVILGGLARLAIAYALVAGAIKAVSNLFDLFKNQYQDINDDVDKLTEGINRYHQAVKDATDAQNKFGQFQPQTEELQLNEGFKVPEWLQGVAGGERLNLDNLVRNRWNKMLDRFDAYNSAVSGGTTPKLKGRITTEAERRQADFQVATGDLNSRTRQLLGDSQPAINAAKEISEFDRQITEVQSKRLELLPGDKKALEESLAAERAINKKRDKQLKILTNYQQTLLAAEAASEEALKRLEAGYARGEFKKDVYESSKASLLDTQDATADKLELINGILSKVTKQLSVFQRELNNSTERINNFIERRGLEAQVERTQIITEGIELDQGDRVIELKLDSASKNEISDYIAELETTVAQGEKRLNSGALAQGYRLVSQSAQKNNLTLDSATIDRMLSEERSQSEKDALGELKALRENQVKLNQYREQLAQNLQGSRYSLVDFKRTIDDFLFNITNQIKEAQIEVLKLVNQIVNASIKNKLSSAISPNADSFVNSLISSTQSLLDQAASYAERVLGQQNARIQFASTKRGLQYELQDFERNVKGAADALQVFEERLRGGGSSSNTGANESSPTTSNGSFAEKTKAIAKRLSIDPTALMTIMLFESAGTLDPKIQGPNVPRQGRGRGLIQFMPATARGLGTSDAALAGMSDIQQLDYVEKYFAQFKGNFGAGKLENLYAAVLAGDPKAINASDGYTTPRLGAQRMQKDFGAKAASLLGSNNVLNVPYAPPVGGGQLPPPPNYVELAKVETNYLVGKQEQQLDLQDSLINNQEKDALDITIANAVKSDRRRVNNEIKDKQYSLDDSVFAQFDLLSQYDFQTADVQAQKDINSVNQAFSNRWREVTKQIQLFEDEITSVNQVINDTPGNVALATTDGERQLLYEQEANAQLLLPVYTESLTALIEQEKKISKAASTALYFVREQNKLKIEQEKLTKANIVLNQLWALTEARGTLEQQKQVKIQQEEARLELAINQIRLNTPEGSQRNEEILGELRQSKVNKENIDYQAQLDELDLEKRLLDYDSGVGDKNAGFLSRYGFNLQADKLRKDSAIAAEKNRFEKELVQIQKDFAGQPDRIEIFTQKAKELNRVNLRAIDQQFKSLRTTVEDFGISAVQGFFTQFTTNLFDGSQGRSNALLEERLRYAEELNQLEKQYQDEPGQLAHLQNRAKLLNEQKLDKISGEFNIFKRVIDLAGQALLEFTKQLVAMVAQQAAAKFISSILGSALGGIGGSVASVGNDYGGGASGASAFVADKGITVGSRYEVAGSGYGKNLLPTTHYLLPNYGRGGNIKSRKVSDRLTNYLRTYATGVRSAWRAEGEGAQLGVFHTGEELLSRKTGEAGRYQALKAKYGFNPLAKLLGSRYEVVGSGYEKNLLPTTYYPLLNYSQGGTVGQFDAEKNMLSGFSSGKTRIDLSGLSEGRRGNSSVSKNFTLNQTIVTPNADSFRLNADQRNQDLLESYKRSV